jgi:uncharacterized membrane protein YfcA
MDVGTAIGLLALAFLVGTYGTIIGAGGGFLLIPALVLIFDLQGANAVGTGAVALMIIGITGAFSYNRQGLVARPVAGWFTLGSVPLALLSGWLLANRIDSRAFTGILGVLLLALAAFVVFGPAMAQSSGPELAPKRRALAAAGSAVGITSGTFAVGGGLITVPLLARMQRLGPHRATATTSATAMASSAAASLGHTIAGNVEWTKAGVLVIGAFVGSSLGARLAGRLSQGAVLVLLAGGLLVAGIPLMVDAA